MLILALDTTTRAGSAALVNDERVMAERAGDAARTHAERLPAELLALLTSQGCTLADVDLFAVAAGPGSFTGLRVGIASLQGLALVRQRPLIGVSALEALAQIGSTGVAAGERIGVWMDAYRREVFSALYSVGSEPPFAPGHLIEIEGAAAGDPAVTLARWQEAGARPAALIGDGAVLAAALPGAAAVRLLAAPALAAAIARLARARALAGDAGHPAALQPLYVRRPDAEVDRDKRKAGAWATGGSTN